MALTPDLPPTTSDKLTAATGRDAAPGEAHDQLALFAAIVRSSSDAIYGSALDGTITHWNPAAERLFGYRAEEALGRHITMLIPPDRRDEFNDLLRLKFEGVADPFETVRLRKDGSGVDVLLSVFPVHDADGVMIGVAAIAQDITTHKRAEAAFRQLQQRYRSLVENIPAVSYIVEATPPHRLVFVSPQIEALLGFTPAEVENTPTEIAARRVHPADFPRLQQEGPRFEDDGQPFSTEYRMIAKDGRVVWVHDRSVIVRDETGRPQYIQGILTDITDRKRMEQQLEYQALYDTLTALPNRTLLLDRLRQALLTAAQQPAGVGFFLLDLDRFKDVNDTFGHFAGDELLRQVAARLRAAVRETDMVARLGGDEFAVIVPSVGDAAAAIAVAQRIHAALEPPFEVEGAALTARASIGIALAPEHGADADTLMRHADVAMYAAKRMQAEYALYAAEQDPNSPDRLALLTDLHHAIETDQLVLHYQPQVELAAGRVSWAEALVRWRHPERGLLAADQFIGLAEQTGLIHPLTLRILGGALAQLGAWERAGLDLGVAVNLSVWDLQDQRLPDRLAELLAASQAQPSRLKLEITESALMADPQQAYDVLRRFQAMGVRLSIDDFGTGYSSLSHLKRLPLDELKIAETFIRDMMHDDNDAIIVRSTIELAHSLGLRTVAEGVEDQAMFERLRAWGCDAAQGYYLGAPLDAALFEQWLRLR